MEDGILQTKINSILVIDIAGYNTKNAISDSFTISLCASVFSNDTLHTQLLRHYSRRLFCIRCGTDYKRALCGAI